MYTKYRVQMCMKFTSKTIVFKDLFKDNNKIYLSEKIVDKINLGHDSCTTRDGIGLAGLRE